jgi:hypothetical protein
MDLDDLLGSIFDDADLGTIRSRRAQLIARMAFGLTGAALCLAGAWIFLTRDGLGGSAVMQGAMAVVFVGLAACCLFNVMLARPWKWPWLLALASLVLLFASAVAGA